VFSAESFRPKKERPRSLGPLSVVQFVIRQELLDGDRDGGRR